VYVRCKEEEIVETDKLEAEEGDWWTGDGTYFLGYDAKKEFCYG